MSGVVYPLPVGHSHGIQYGVLEGTAIWVTPECSCGKSDDGRQL